MRDMKARAWTSGAIALSLVLIASACTVNSQARIPDPNVLAERQTGGSFEIDVSSVPEAAHCSAQGGLKDLCVTQFRTAIGGGLQKVLSQFVDKSKPGPAYSATFKLVEFSHSATSGAGPRVGPSVKVTMRWQFVLKQAGDKVVAQLAETTDGPEQLSHPDAADKAIKSLLNAVMEQIAGVLNAATWS
jgi:hypothetical protein